MTVNQLWPWESVAVKIHGKARKRRVPMAWGPYIVHSLSSSVKTGSIITAPPTGNLEKLLLHSRIPTIHLTLHIQLIPTSIVYEGRFTEAEDSILNSQTRTTDFNIYNLFYYTITMIVQSLYVNHNFILFYLLYIIDGIDPHNFNLKNI